MCWFAPLTRVVMFLCSAALAAAAVVPASAHAPAVVAAAPMTLTVTVADNGGTVQVGAGGDLLVELPGNPSTGYLWQVIANDDSILLPITEWFEPDSNMPGSPGLEKFSFHVMAPGTASMRLVYSQPWETDTPPEQTFAVTVEAVDQAAPTAPVTVGSADGGKTVALLPGQLLQVALEGESTGAWEFMGGDPMIVQQVGDWVTTPLGGDPARFLATRTFLGVQPGTVNLKFGYSVPGNPEWWFDPTFNVTVVVSQVQQGNSTAVGEGDSGKAVALAAGDTLVVRLRTVTDGGYAWKVMATDAALLPAAGPAQCAYYGEILLGWSAACTFRFRAQAAGRVTLRLGNFQAGKTEPDNTVEYDVTIADPVPLTGTPIPVTEAQAGSTLQLEPGARLFVMLDFDPGASEVWLVMARDPAVLRLLPASGPPPSNIAGEAAGTQRLDLQVVGTGQSDLAIGLFATGIPTPIQIFTATATVDWAQHQYLPKVGRP